MYLNNNSDFTWYHGKVVVGDRGRHIKKIRHLFHSNANNNNAMQLSFNEQHCNV
jgi:hypothetical protein